METTNDELMARIQLLDAKVNILSTRMEQAMGAWFFIKLLASCAIGLTVLLSAVKAWLPT